VVPGPRSQVPGETRDFEASDLEAAFLLDQTCFEREIAYTRGQIRSFLVRSGAIGLVAEDEEGLAGFAIGHVAGARGHVVTIDIASRQRRKGLGKRLLSGLMDRMAGAGAREVRLEVDLRNAAAIRFYERMGFERKRSLPDYYGPGFDGLRMTRRV
jgi:ribosomal-protein-alanine N-acetyltransferase